MGEANAVDPGLQEEGCSAPQGVVGAAPQLISSSPRYGLFPVLWWGPLLDRLEQMPPSLACVPGLAPLLPLAVCHSSIFGLCHASLCAVDFLACYC